MLKYSIIRVGILQVNCYLLWNDGAKEALVIDPGDEPEAIIGAIAERGLVPVGILLTHGHVDHIRGVSDVSAKYGVPVWIHEADRALYANPDNAIMPWIPAAQDLPDIAEAVPELPGCPFEIIHTPGHTPGGVCYYFKDAKELFSGDTLFQGTYGRTDFPGGNAQALFSSIREKLFTLPDDVNVHPGHNEPTTIGTEKTRQHF